MRYTLFPVVASVLVAMATTSATAGQRERTATQLLHDVAQRITSYGSYTVFDDVAVALDEGVVTLTGKVTADFKRTAIAERVSELRGVRELHNEIELLPSSEQDDVIREEVARMIYGADPVDDVARPNRFQALRDDRGIDDYGSHSLRAGGSAWLAGRNHELGESDVWGPVGHWPSSAWHSAPASGVTPDMPAETPVHIVVEYARVTLKGVVSDDAERLRMVSLAASTLGVRSISNELRTQAEVREDLEHIGG